MKGRFKNLARNLALSAATLALCFLVTEVVLRFAGFGNLEIYSPDPQLFWRLKPNQDCYTKIGRKPVHVNSHGVRGPEIPLEKPANTLRILSLGDSTAFGWGLADEETYARRLERILNEKIEPGRKVQVINAGVNAWSYMQMLAYLRKEGLKFAPDYVLVGGANHWTQFSENSSPDFVKAMMNRVRLKNLLRRFALYHYVVEVRLENLYQKYRTRFVPIDPKNDNLFKDQQREDPNKVFEDAVQGICELARANSAQPVLLFLPAQNGFEQTNPAPSLVIKRSIHDKSGVPLLDLSETIRPVLNETYLPADPIHLNSKGNEIVADALAAFFATNLISTPRSPEKSGSLTATSGQ